MYLYLRHRSHALIVASGSVALCLAAVGAGGSVPGPRVPGASERVSVSTTGGDPNGASSSPAISREGRYVAFTSLASNLVGDDSNGLQDVFVRDRQLGTTTRVSTASNGAQADGVSGEVAISPDGRYIAFSSNAGNLVANDFNGVKDVFLKDLQTGTVERVSLGADDGTTSEGVRDSDHPSVNEGGRYVAWDSPDENFNGKVYVRDRQQGTTQLVSVDNAGATGDSRNEYPFLSADGQYVAFSSDDLYADSFFDVVVRDRVAGITHRLNLSAQGQVANFASGFGGTRISGNGERVVFVSSADNLTAGDENNQADIFSNLAHAASAPDRLSLASNGAEADLGGRSPDISDNCRFVVFTSLATNLATGDGLDVFVRDRFLGSTARIATTNGQAASGDNPRISGNGRWIAFSSSSSNLAPGDGNNLRDIYVVQHPLAPVPGTVTCVEPGFGARGKSVTATVLGSGFAGTQAPNLPGVFSGEGVSVQTLSATSTAIGVRLTVASAAAAGYRSVVVTNADGAASTPQANGFLVTTSPGKGVLAAPAPTFARTAVGSSSTANLTLKNTGRGSLAVQVSQAIRITGPFTLEGPCGPFLLAPKGKPGSSLPLTLRFTPTQTGIRTGKLTLLSDDPVRKKLPVTLRATGTTPG